MQFTTQQKFVDTFRNSVTTFSIDKRGCCKSGKINATKTFNSNNFQISQDSKNKNQQLLQEGGLLWEDSTKLQEEFGFIDKFLQSQDVLEVPEAGQLSDTTQAIILAGGSSSNPLAQYRAIAATPLGSNLKVIDSTIHNCMKSGIDKIYVLTQFNSQPLNSYISNSYKPTIFGRQHSWVEVLASNQTPQYKAWARGSADAVRRNFPTLLNRWHGAELPQEFLIVSAEAVCSIDYTKLLTAHRLMGADITMATTSVEADKASSLGLCIIDPLTCKVLDFAEKPCAEKLKSMKGQDIHSTERMPYEASMGIYVFNRQVLVELLEGQEDNNSHNNEQWPDFGCEGIKVQRAHQPTSQCQGKKKKWSWQNITCSVYRKRKFPYNMCAYSQCRYGMQSLISDHILLAIKRITSTTSIQEILLDFQPGGKTIIMSSGFFFC
eukprot:TRINITY_DN4215_c0_g1_i7.p1 TRINITY_DN4215_c0_g1~~TRINITY_DN4215_c0_g1_i7.p1  ORF type:complete len:435 (+),score=52.88 TRINITY_DN4215_c0_g1_i7:76-1380(+)